MCVCVWGGGGVDEEFRFHYCQIVYIHNRNNTESKGWLAFKYR